ncbi:hypothetical protein EZJ19_03985 [Parasulfuritortus cantonensis]|uniref:Chorismate-utilising enzyme C-terminal domain-containing protein n=1 Tax=Parasulfuritortus cantonensis TaxID=2528202 RepID=A0A4R1BIT4_9PROT|nr:chorismate-binding protein [Parasulfuritortus cantonensis]TCJ17117.1 hypothetical protein EZJ19_03985 [Parasulfuritortus cantonensis]
MSQTHDVLSKGSRLYRRMQELGDPGLAPGYLFHIPESGRTWLGVAPERTITLGADGFAVDAGGVRTTVPAGARPFQTLRQLIDPARPCFFMISLDIQRRSRDPALPLMEFVQPAMEARFGSADGVAILAADGADRSALETLLAELPEGVAEPQPVAQTGTPVPWHTEPDAEFLKRIEAAVAALQSVVGKMIITRAYDKPVRPGADPFRLFEIYAGNERGAAATHFAALGRDTFSLGCSPENVFELDHGKLSFDVVASTRGISPDPEVDARWLQELLTDAKERHEHLMALERYRIRLAGLCEAGSVREEQLMGVRTLRRVRHLHSRLSGRLRPGIDFLDLLEESYPPLSSYPAELVPLSDPDTQPLRYYAGIVGRAAPGGSEVSCFLNLRSALLLNGTLHTQGGVGVIAEAKPQQETLEVANKLRSLLEAVTEWETESGR